jgi:starch phosphorylase
MKDQIDALTQKIRHTLLLTSGKTLEDASNQEFYLAFAIALQEQIILYWHESQKAIDAKKAKVIYFLSMEYLPGKYLSRNIWNLQEKELVQATLQKLGRKMADIIPCEADPGLGNGGLGRLSACFLDSLATLHYPAKAYGLRYQYGIFEQEIWNGVQVERPDCWLLHTNPWECRRDSESRAVLFGGTVQPSFNQFGDEIDFLKDFDEVRAIPYDLPVIGYNTSNCYTVTPLRLWSTKESPRNFMLQRYNAGLFEEAAENLSLTDVLYPNDNHELGKKIRLKQEFLLVSASLQDALRHTLKIHGNLKNLSDKLSFQINDTHPALLIAELIRVLMKQQNFSWDEAKEATLHCCSYTNHTILREALEEWNEGRIATLLPRQYKIIERLNLDLCNTVRNLYPNDEEKVQRVSMFASGQIRMAHLAIFGSHKVNGVSRLHTEVLKKDIFPDFAEMFPDKFIPITNGISHRRFLIEANPLLTEFIIKRIGSGWISDFSEIKKLLPFAKEISSQDAFLQIKKKNKENFLDFLTKENPIRDRDGNIIAHPHFLDTSALFDVQIKRFHEYKRQLLSALHLIMIYQEISQNPNARNIKRFSVFAGTAAPGYARAKQIMMLIYAILRKFHATPETCHMLCGAFIENYDVSKAEKIIPAADLSEQISLAGWEASGTGNMKLAMNGALTIATDDGSNIEIKEAVGPHYWPFSFGITVSEYQKPYHPSSIYTQDKAIAQALHTLKDQTFATNQEEAVAFADLYNYLTDEDPFRVLQDLRAYYETQKKVETLFQNPLAWAETALHTIASMGTFSSDRAIRSYAKDVWGLLPCPPSSPVNSG